MGGGLGEEFFTWCISDIFNSIYIFIFYGSDDNKISKVHNIVLYMYYAHLYFDITMSEGVTIWVY